MERTGIHRAVYYLVIVLFIASMLFVSSHAAGEVVPITELKDKLENITDEEKAVLTELFMLEQDVAALEADERKITDEIEQMKKSIKQLENSIEEKQSAYDRQCDILKQVLVNYQRRGPASYLEILLRAEDLSDFIKSLNIIKDISHNTNELLNELRDRQKELKEKKSSLEEENAALEQKRNELAEKIQEKQKLQQQKEDYLASLKQESEYYRNQLELIENIWENCKKLFPQISRKITDLIGAGNISPEDLNLKFSLFNISGYIEEETFNKVLSDNTGAADAVFRFEEGRAVIEFPQEKLLLKGNFVITGKSAVSFEADEGCFYDLPLEKGSIDELFENGSLTIDFEQITDDVITIDFKITDVSCHDGTINFAVVPQF